MKTQKYIKSRLAYTIRPSQADDCASIVEIYNSNPQFLLHHLGTERIDEAFVIKEIANMREMYFTSSVIIDIESGSICGVLDYKSREEVYLSLMMLKADMQGQGLGSDIYAYFEEMMLQEGQKCIRIDVINDYDNNLITFWKKYGFLECGNTVLEWGNKKSNAVIMKKDLLSIVENNLD